MEKFVIGEYIQKSGFVSYTSESQYEQTFRR